MNQNVFHGNSSLDLSDKNLRILLLEFTLAFGVSEVSVVDWYGFTRGVPRSALFDYCIHKRYIAHRKEYRGTPLETPVIKEYYQLTDKGNRFLLNKRKV